MKNTGKEKLKQRPVISAVNSKQKYINLVQETTKFRLKTFIQDPKMKCTTIGTLLRKP